MSLNLLLLAFEAAHAEHAISGSIHASKGCHACTLIGRLLAAVREEEKQWPNLKAGSLWGLGGGNKAALFTSEPMTHRQWEMLKRLVDIMEPEPDAVSAAPSTPTEAGR
ncbi:MAG TPA: hypothetical protein PK948_05005 [Gemmatimonadales bacterium]|nr:hypothetical protein [Gemmatimonadales bacterium]